MLLEHLGQTVEVASDGGSALASLETARPDLALVDIGLPGIDGYEVARRARATPQGRGALLVALTGYGHPEDRKRAIAAGFDEHVTKPIDVERLERLLARASRSGREAAARR
jgi:hypothetical protein